jgi:FtsZ-interacting cell division protein ZipA
MMDILIIVGLIVVLPVLIVSVVLLRRRPRKINTDRFQEKWRDMQKQLADKSSWKQAVVDADKLLDEALKKKRFPGKTMGERLTKAQRILSDNENVWYGHKLRNKLETEPEMKLKEADVKQALLGIRQALKDLGALPDGK